jgi:molybdopterin synthase sulfur carrier subunit
VKILLFGALGEEIGREVEGELPPEGCSVADLRRLLVDRNPSCAPLARPSVRACVDQAIVPEDFVVRPGQEVAFVPPLSGG